VFVNTTNLEFHFVLLVACFSLVATPTTNRQTHIYNQTDRHTPITKQTHTHTPTTKQTDTHQQPNRQTHTNNQKDRHTPITKQTDTHQQPNRQTHTKNRKGIDTENRKQSSRLVVLTNTGGSAAMQLLQVIAGSSRYFALLLSHLLLDPLV